MELAILQDYLRPGGTEKQSLLLTRSWTQTGVSAALVTFRPGGPLAPLAEQMAVPVRALQPFDSRLDFWAPGWRGLLAEPSLKGVLLMGRNANSRGVSIKARRPELTVVGTVRTGRSLTRSYQRSLEVADIVVANSAWAADRIRSEGIRCQRLEVIPNARTLEWAPGEQDRLRNAMRQQLQLSEDLVVLLQVASMIPGKNYTDLLEIAAALDATTQPWELWCVGSGPQAGSVRQMARQLRIADRVRFPGFQQDIKPWLAAADLMVTTSREESAPNAVIEAQLSGLPVVGYDTAGMKELVRDQKSGYLVEPGNQDDFLERLRRLMADPELRAHQGQAGILHAQTFPDATMQGARYLELFELSME